MAKRWDQQPSNSVTPSAGIQCEGVAHSLWIGQQLLRLGDDPIIWHILTPIYWHYCLAVSASKEAKTSLLASWCLF